MLSNASNETSVSLNIDHGMAEDAKMDPVEPTEVR
jgi:hypothetical protein